MMYRSGCHEISEGNTHTKKNAKNSLSLAKVFTWLKSQIGRYMTEHLREEKEVIFI